MKENFCFQKLKLDMLIYDDDHNKIRKWRSAGWSILPCHKQLNDDTCLEKADGYLNKDMMPTLY